MTPRGENPERRHDGGRRAEDDGHLKLPTDFGWRTRLIGALMFFGGVVGYVADIIPYESKRHAAEQATWIARDIEVIKVWDREQKVLAEARMADHERILDELLRNQIRVMQKIGLEPQYRFYKDR